MSTVAYELVDSMSGSVTTEQESFEVQECKRRFVVGQFTGFNAVKSFMDGFAPRYAIDDGVQLYWTRTQLDIKSIGNKYYDVTATYRTLQPSVAPTGDDGGDNNNGGGGSHLSAGSIGWDTTGRTEHITQALGETGYPDGVTYFEEAINVSGDAVQGIDVVRPSMKYTETWLLPATLAMSPSFMNGVHRLTGTVNASPFRAFAAGEALFLGAKGQWSGDSPFVAVTFEFECRPNVNDFYVKAIPPFPKKGWEYVWVRYQPEGGMDIVRRPIAAYKNTLYHERAWDALVIAGRSIGGAKSGRRRTAPQPGLPQGF